MEKELIINNIKTNYIISDKGKIFNKNTNKELTGTIRSGYRMVKLTVNKIKKDYCIHKLVAETFIPNPNNYTIVNHKDRNKLNNNISNLEWVTLSLNILHSRTNGNIYSKRLKIYPIEEDLIIDEEHGWKLYRNSNYWGNLNGVIINKKTKKYLNTITNPDGYLIYSLYIDKKRYTKLAHRMIYEIFTDEILDSKIDINHIDGNKLNNAFENLEKVTRSKNMIHSFYILRKNTKPILQYDLNDNFIKEFPSVSEAARLIGGVPSGITQACLGKVKTYYKYKWKYKEV